jgi:serine protease Do
LKLRVAETPPGSKAAVIVSRNGEDKTFDVTVGNAPANKVAKADETNGIGRKEALAGVAVTDLDRNSRAELNVPDNIEGAITSQVVSDSPAYEAGLRTGVIIELNHQPVKSARDVVADTEKQTDWETLVKV